VLALGVAASTRGSNTFVKTSISNSKDRMVPKALVGPDCVACKVKDG